MNLLLYSLFGPIEGYFFTEETVPHQEKNFYKKFSVPPRSGIIDEISKFSEAKDIEKIFVVSGPASFTSLRNISVFVQTFQNFSTKKIKVFSLPTKNFFELLYPNHSQYILSVGRRESFLLQNQGYKKYKNPQIIEKLEENFSNLAGFFSPQVLENFSKNFSVPEPDTPENFLPKIREQQEKFFVEQLVIDYGAMPNIG